MTRATTKPLREFKLLPNSAMLISGLTWADYLAALEELGDARLTRVAYFQGVIQIRMPGELHEVINRLLAAIIMTLALELGLEANDFGSVTLNRQGLDVGIEPDTCFYIQNAVPGQGLATKVTQTLPPDLALEVDIASSSASRMQIYQAMKVPELWVYQGDLKIQMLQDSEYVNISNSLAFPMVDAQQLNQWIELRRNSTDTSVMRTVRQFCRKFTIGR